MALPNIINEINTIKSTYLPKSGGTMTGVLTVPAPFIINSQDSDREGGELVLKCPSSSYPIESRIDNYNNETRIIAVDTSQDKVVDVVSFNHNNHTISLNGNTVLTSAGGKMTGSINKDGTSVSWRTILDNSPDSSFLYQNTYTGYMPALNLKTNNGRVGIGTYENYLALTYFLDTNTTNNANTQLNLLSNGTATIGGRPIVCVTSWKSGTNWYRVYSDGWIEQGGYVYCGAHGTWLSYYLPFSDTGYYLNANAGEGTNGVRFVSFYSRNTTGAGMYTGDDSSFNSANLYWYACGY